jgi:hypothetical protein
MVFPYRVSALNAQRLRRALILQMLVCLVFIGSSVQPASAYNFPFGVSNGYGWNSLSGLAYTVPMMFGGGYYTSGFRNVMYSPPGYLPYGSQRLFQPSTQQQYNNGSNGNGAPTGNNNNNNNASPTYQNGYTDPEPLSSPRQRTRQKRNGKGGIQDQVSYAQWAPNGAQGAGKNGAPPMAPPHQGFAPNMGAPSAVPGGPSPFAEGFVKTVNDQFHGDISKALFDPGTRGWAKALGMTHDDGLFDADLSESRVDVVRKIFHDPTLDAQSKINAAKILLNSSQKN